jgi:hypothetical protein
VNWLRYSRERESASAGVKRSRGVGPPHAVAIKNAEPIERRRSDMREGEGDGDEGLEPAAV